MTGYATIGVVGFRWPIQLCVVVPDGPDWEKRMRLAMELTAILHATGGRYDDVDDR